MITLPPPSLSFRTQIASLFLAWQGITSITSQALFAQAIREQDIFPVYILRGKTETAFREDVVARSLDLIERVKHACELDTAQLEKLQLAAEGDVVRFYREFEHVKSEVKGLKANDAQARQRLSPLMQRVQQGIFDDNALCQAVLETTLNPRQLEQFQNAEAKRRNYAFTAICKSTIAEFSREIPLTGEQREMLLAIMLSVPRPKKSRPQLESIVGVVILGKAFERVEEESGLDKKQLNHLIKLLERVRGMEGNFEW